MKPKIFNHFNREERPIREYTVTPSLTVPDQSMTIREILERYARGLPLEAGKVPIYHGEDNPTVDLNAMELTDRMDFIQETMEKGEKAKKDLDEQKQARKKKKEKDALIQEIEAEYELKPKEDGSKKTTPQETPPTARAVPGA